MTERITDIVLVCRPGFEDRADFLSAELNLKICAPEQAETQGATLALWLDERGLSLRQLGPKMPGPVLCDFIGGVARHRRLYGGGKGQDIARAVGLSKQGFKPTVLDLTAGLGQDAFVLASLGAQVIMVERHPIVYALLADGLARARAATEDEQLQSVLARMQLCNDDASNYLRQPGETDTPDIIYIDPMFPPREKSAKVKKEMQLFHQLVGENADADALLLLALERARYRVVVKRPSHAPFLGESEPGYSLKGKSTRFDIYPVKKLPDRKLSC